MAKQKSREEILPSPVVGEEGSPSAVVGEGGSPSALVGEGRGGGSVSVALFDREGNETGQVELPGSVFNAPVSAAVLHQAVLRQQANDRQGTHQTKTRGDVSGGGKKPWKQKGTGRARQGSTRAPQWRHGGTVFGPHPRSYEQKMPRKQRRNALRGALSVKHQEGAVRVVEEIALEQPKTSVLAGLFDQMGAGARTLFVIREHDLNLEKSTRNLAGVRTILASNLSPAEVVTADTVVFTRSALTEVEEWLAGSPAHATGGGVAPREPRSSATRAFETSERAKRAFEAS